MQTPVVRQAPAPVLRDGSAEAGRIGLILLATDLTSERDFARMVPTDEIGVYCSRVAYTNPTTPENLRKMEPDISQAAALILPGEKLDAVCYSCTAASVVIGDEEIEAAVARGKPGVPVVTPPAAVRAALSVFNACKISILTPYTQETSAPMALYFVDHGFDVKGLSCFGLEDDRQMARVTADSIIAAARDAMSPESEALFISCTALRAAEVAEEIETVIGKPVITSNQASVWMSLRLVGYDRAIDGFGRLLRTPLSDEDE
jgi:maleate isomerase